jgi:hypothetical protein
MMMPGCRRRAMAFILALSQSLGLLSGQETSYQSTSIYS